MYHYTLIDLTETDDPDTGDIYSGLDRFGRVKDNRWYNFDSEEDLDRIQYAYDRAGNRIWRHNLVAASLSEECDEIYYYDGVHRLKEMQRGTLNGDQTALTSKTFAQCWTLDSTGNWTGFREDDNGDNTWNLIQERTANGVNEITNLTNTTGPAWSSPAYNRAGNMTTIPTPQTAGLDWNTLSTDEWSDLTTDEWAGLDASLTRSATYDAWNRLVTITDNDVILSDYAYDGAKRRIVQRSYTEGVLAETRHSYYTEPTQWQILEERLGSSPDSSDAERQFVWDLRYIDDLIARDRDTNADGTLDERLYACQDGNWNVTAIVDDSGAAQERYAYSAYGVPVFLTAGFGTVSGSASSWETLYCGYRWETAMALFHVRNRVFLTAIGTWLQRDPIRYSDSLSLLQYSTSRPISFFDPYGLTSITCSCEVFREQPRGGRWVETSIETPCPGLAASCCSQACNNLPGASRWNGEWNLTNAMPDNCPPAPCSKSACRQECVAMGIIIANGCRLLPPIPTWLRGACVSGVPGLVILCAESCNAQCAAPQTSTRRWTPFIN